MRGMYFRQITIKQRTILTEEEVRKIVVKVHKIIDSCVLETQLESAERCLLAAENLIFHHAVLDEGRNPVESVKYLLEEKRIDLGIY